MIFLKLDSDHVRFGKIARILSLIYNKAVMDMTIVNRSDDDLADTQELERF